MSARLVSGGALVGFARATSDHALNGTIWDVVTDPALPDEVRLPDTCNHCLICFLKKHQILTH